MPYNSVADLPAHVKKLSDSKQRQWMHVFNSCSRDGGDEGKCFRMANGVAKKDLEVVALETADPIDFPGEAEADELAQIEKSYQYVDSYEYETRKTSQEDAGYNPVGGSGTKACSNCVFFVSPARCTLVAGEIAPNGLSSHWKGIKKIEPEPIPVRIVKEAEVVMSSGALKSPAGHTFKELFERALRALSGVKGGPATTGFRVDRQKDGSLRWFARYSNSWEDKDKEVITQASHEEYNKWVTATGNYPELWLWHTAGTRFGQADWHDYSDGFAFASGLVDSDKEYVVEALAKSDVGVSHGFLCVQDGKYITKHRSFEISALPSKRASAWNTDFNVSGKETEMGFTKDKRDFLSGILGEDAVKELEANTSKAVDAMKALGVEFKAFEQEAAPEPAAAPAVAQAAVDDAGIKALGGLMRDLIGTVNGLASAVASQKETLETLQKSDDDKVADALAGRISNALRTGGFRASEAEQTVTKAKEDEPKVEDPFADINRLIGLTVQQAAPAAAAGGVGTPAAAAVTVQQ